MRKKFPAMSLHGIGSSGKLWKRGSDSWLVMDKNPTSEPMEKHYVYILCLDIFLIWFVFTSLTWSYMYIFDCVYMTRMCIYTYIYIIWLFNQALIKKKTCGSPPYQHARENSELASDFEERYWELTHLLEALTLTTRRCFSTSKFIWRFSLNRWRNSLSFGDGQSLAGQTYISGV